MKTRTSAWIWSTMALALAGCSSERWVDAPQACEKGWAPLKQAVATFLTQKQLFGPKGGVPPSQLEFVNQYMDAAKSSDDLREVRNRMLAINLKRGHSEEASRRDVAVFDQLVGEGARSVCGNVGMSYTGEWECNAKQQRVKCK
jgi:hypothetical protein